MSYQSHEKEKMLHDQPRQRSQPPCAVFSQGSPIIITQKRNADLPIKKVPGVVSGYHEGSRSYGC